VLAALGVTDPTAELLEQLERPVDRPVFEAYPEVAPVLERLVRAGLDLAVVTDSWGTSQTKRAQLAEVGLDRYFAAVVVSEELGCTKPDPRMFDTAATALGHRRERCLFVDDDPELVRAACRLGYHGIAVVRDGQPRPDDVPVATTLTDLLAHLGLEGKDPDAPSRREVLVSAEVFDRRPAAVFDPGAGDLDPEAAAVRDELLDLLRELVATKLTPRQREIVELSYVEGLTQAEIAERLGIRQQVVSKHLFGVVRDGKRIGGAIRRLRQLCEEHGIDPDRWV
jgi:RNA polymerase sigma factor (sigma-70 family)